MEVERKYLLSALPPREILGRGVEIRQGYIDAADPEIRVRQKGPASFLTIKSGAGLQRQECEVQIPAATFEKLWPLTEGARIVKTRYTVQHGDARWEIDEFGGTVLVSWVVSHVPHNGQECGGRHRLRLRRQFGFS